MLIWLLLVYVELPFAAATGPGVPGPLGACPNAIAASAKWKAIAARTFRNSAGFTSVRCTKQMFCTISGRIFKSLTFLEIAAKPLQIALEKGTNLVSGHVFERKLTHGVVAAGQNGYFVVPLVFACAADHLP